MRRPIWGATCCSAWPPPSPSGPSTGPPGPTPSQLLDAGITKVSQKVGEEAVEVVVAANSEDASRLASETADLLYHLLVLLQARGVPLDAVWRELDQRSALTMSFVHLHTHSEYSLLDGANRIPDLVAHVKKLGMDSLAVTDHGNLHAAWAFYEEAKSAEDPADPRLRGLPRVRPAHRRARSRPGRRGTTATSCSWPRTGPATGT